MRVNFLWQSNLRGIKLAQIFYHASHEQFSPRDLPDYTRMAEQAGFDGCHSSDHFHPWSKRQGHSGHLFSWMGAALEATKFPMSFITTPGQRYHPAVVAQAISTMAHMYPDRLTVELGSGEALNEHITGDGWPEKSERNERLFECFTVIQQLLAGKKVNHTGRVKVQDAMLYTLPSGNIPRLFCAAVTDVTARWAGGWAEGLITVYKPLKELQKTINTFYEGGGEGKPIHVKLTFSYARSYQCAREEAFDQWRANCLDNHLLEYLSTPEEFDIAAESVTHEKVMTSIPISDSPLFFADIISELFSLGVETIVLHNVNRNQPEFIADFGSVVTSYR